MSLLFKIPWTENFKSKKQIYGTYFNLDSSLLLRLQKKKKNEFNKVFR